MRFALLFAAVMAVTAPALPARSDVDIAALRGVDVVILGEIHDNPHHHAWQAEVLGALDPRAIVFEMLSSDQAARITPALRADPDALARAIGWSDSGWPDFALYRPVFEALGEAMLFGAAIPYEDVRAGMTEGAAGHLDGDATRFGLDRPLPTAQQALREALQAAAHCDALPETLLPGMVEAQRLRDAAFASRVLEALAVTGGPVVLITGNGHARRDWAVPHLIALAAPGVSVLSVGQFEAVPDGDVPHDLWRVTPPAQREDPCRAFN